MNIKIHPENHDLIRDKINLKCSCRTFAPSYLTIAATAVQNEQRLNCLQIPKSYRLGAKATFGYARMKDRKCEKMIVETIRRTKGWYITNIFVTSETGSDTLELTVKQRDYINKRHTKYWPEMDLKKIPPHRRNNPPKKCPQCGSIRVDLNSACEVDGCLICHYKKEREPVMVVQNSVLTNLIGKEKNG